MMLELNADIDAKNRHTTTSQVKQMQFLVTGRDGSDAEALNRRMAVREDHIALGDKLRAEGKMLIGVALLNEAGDMAGSVILVDMDSREEIDEWLKVEPYVTGNVWHSVEVEPCRVGPSFQSLFTPA